MLSTPVLLFAEISRVMKGSKENERLKLTRRQFVGGTLAASALASLSVPDVSAAGRPNILFILADDLGWGDLSCYGRPDFQTPNLDRLAKEGVRFTNAYSAAPVCTPTRVAFHTGRYPARLSVGLEEPLTARRILADRVKSIGIPYDHPTVSSLIRKAGYETALIGKWHVGYLPDFGPLKYGFEEFFGITSGAGDHFSHTDPAGEPDLFEGETPVKKVGYLTELLTDRAVQYIRRPRKKPFYLSLHYTSPHWPWQGPGDKRTSGTFKPGPVGFSAGGSIKIYGEMMKSLDAAVGTVMNALRSAGLDKNTLVIFTSDNGGERFSYNWPFTGAKFDLHEGGIRVPAIVRWPGVATASQVSDQPVITMDWTATMTAAAGAAPDPRYFFDGDDLTPVLAGKQPLYDRHFFWRTRTQEAMRSGNWKYFRQDNKEFLFDLSADEREQADFAEKEPRTLSRLRAGFDKWRSEMQKYPARN